MKFLQSASDGGKDSGVSGFFLIEVKPLFSVVFLRFRNGTREAFHSHAFNAVTLWLRGRVREHMIDGTTKEWRPGQFKYTARTDFHKVESLGDTWALSIRGPWADHWYEFRNNRYVTLTHGRREVL